MSTSMKTKTMESGGSGGSTSIKTTTYTSSSSSYGDEGTQSYKSRLYPRQTIITRSSYGQPGGRMEVSRSSGGYSMSSVPSGSFANVSATGVSHIKNSREREKKDMQDLNERFASYIEKVRFLEAQNRKLAAELDALKQKWGKETTAIKLMYQTELDEARKLLDDAEKEKARLEIRVHTLEDQIDELREKVDELTRMRNADRETIERQNQQLSDYEAEINLLRRRIASLEDERTHDKKEIVRLTNELSKLRVDLDTETLNHIDAENRRQTLEEEIEFLKNVHEQELKELAALAYRDTTAENREFWKNELAQCLREITAAYDEKLEGIRGELETYYNLKVQEFRTGATRQNMEASHSKEESKRLRTQLQDLRAKLADLEARNAMLEKELEMLRREYEEKEREWELERQNLTAENAKLQAEMEAMLAELQAVMDAKLSLELEITAYRKLLEGEENRVGLRNIVDSFIETQSGGRSSGGGGGSGSGGAGGDDDDSSMRMSQVVKGEMSAKTTYQRSAKGPLQISECNAEGKFVVVENTSNKDVENVDGWKIVRSVEGNPNPYTYTFSNVPALKPRTSIKVWAKGAPGMQTGAGNTEAANIGNWGVGANITTKLYNTTGEDRASHVQKTIYSS